MSPESSTFAAARVFGAMYSSQGVALVRNVFRAGVLAATLVTLGISGAQTGFAANSGSGSTPEPPLVTLKPGGVIHVDAPADGSGWTCKGMSLLPPVTQTARVSNKPVSTGSAMLDSTPWLASVDLQFPPSATVLWECSTPGSGNRTIKSEGVLQTLP